MPTNRRIIRRAPKSRITPHVLEVYQRALVLHNDPKAEEYEEDGKGGKKRAYCEASYELNHLLGISISDEQVLDTIGYNNPNDVPTGIYAPWDVESWKEALTIRLELEKALKASLGDSHAD